MKILYFFIGCFLFSAYAFASDSIDVEITVVGFRTHTGVCRCLIFDHQNGFPESVHDANANLNQPIESDTVHFSVRLQQGRYALSVLHDENANGKMDKTWYGKPIEGFGTSNNPVIKFSPPSFSTAAVAIDASHTRIDIKLQYL